MQALIALFSARSGSFLESNSNRGDHSSAWEDTGECRDELSVDGPDAVLTGERLTEANYEYEIGRFEVEASSTGSISNAVAQQTEDMPNIRGCEQFILGVGAIY